MKTFYALGLPSIALYAVVVPAHATSTSAAVGFGHLPTAYARTPLLLKAGTRYSPKTGRFSWYQSQGYPE